ncbi:3-hydroxyacyl-CoA dehydrogenase/enoyl-CoA hydratase family protein [Pelagibacteraceae bacterium]|nr:3-hydroxyacyl-CoA dehydrogenase/enoyl-CoA hydratase family protein [Pelagibacteraceae bacterium]
MNIKKVVVIGSGTMGSGIAAQVANAGISVTLLDLPSNEGSRNQITEKAKERIIKSRPPLLVEKTKAENIETGNIEDDFSAVSEADWVVEAVVERIDIKHSIYSKIQDARKPSSVISSNTSTIPLKVLSANMSEDMKKNFCITHFFNPVRYMALLEIVTEPINDTKKINFLKSFCDEQLGKGVIICNDTPGFIGNRIGVYAMQVAMTEAFKTNISIEEADAVFGRPMGIPKTGIFGLYDLIGIDLMADVLKSFIKELPIEDPFHEVAQEIPLVKKLIDTGYTGRKGKGGFYRMNKSDGKKILEAINLETGEYSPSKKINLGLGDKIDIKKLIERDDKYGKYAKSILTKVIRYAAFLIPDVSSKYIDIDDALRLGFNWTIGPFEMLSHIETNSFIRENTDINYFDTIQNNFKFEKRPGYLDPNIDNLRSLKLEKTFHNASANVQDSSSFQIVEFTTKANALNTDSMLALKEAAQNNKSTIIINEAMQFSAGVNLNYVMDFAKNNEWSKIEKFIVDFQQTCKAIKYADKPFIAAPSGLAIGGGFEVVLHCDYSVSHTNVVLGLVESLVGLIPAGGGCKEMLWRWLQTPEGKENSEYASMKVFDLIGYAITSSSPNEAKPNQFFLSKDKVVINRDRQLTTAIELLNNIESNYIKPSEPVFRLGGSSVKDKMFEKLEKLYSEKKIMDHSLEVGKQIAFVLSGGDTNMNSDLTEDDLYNLELEAFMRLIQMPKTQERIKHTLETGKPLVN